ncbi:response regulator [Kovacikia minuta CCNUW1]|uniref:response regulator n=1 Tax=Kovacikia minuta TaxID=2931930 RepID=UPI001CCE7BA5|nr:response regulator [Kovacikia minuta]UBF25761.1 response regulator [Kovacikia minuta CCNUW1]
MYRIAVIDDNAAWCFALENFLSLNGFAVSTFNDAGAFFKVAEQFDMALVDFSMPSPCYQKEINGPELIAQVKQRLRRRPILILVSAYFTEEILRDARYICPEADAHLSKSAGLKGILHKVTQFAEEASGVSSSLRQK